MGIRVWVRDYAPCALEMQQQSLFQSLQKHMNIFSLYSMTPISELGAVLLCRHEVQDKLLFIVRERVYSKHLNGGDSLFQGRMIYSGIIYHRRIDYSGVEHPGGYNYWGINYFVTPALMISIVCTNWLWFSTLHFQIYLTHY